MPLFGHFITTVALATVVMLAPTGAITGLLLLTSTITLLSTRITGPPGPLENKEKPVK